MRKPLLKALVMLSAFIPFSLVSPASGAATPRAIPCRARVSNGDGKATLECPCKGTCLWDQYTTSCCTPGFRCYHYV